jgi:hypothetical protein
MSLKDSFRREAEVQWPRIRYDLYKWGSIILGTSLVALLVKLMRSATQLPDIYFYGGLFIFTCLVFSLIIEKLRFSASKGADEKDNAVPASNAVPFKRTAALILAPLVVLAIWSALLQHRVRHLEVEMLRYVLPRALSKEQIDTFGKYLSSHSKPREVTIKYISGDAESTSYAQDLSSAFRAGNWLPDMKPIAPSAVTCRPSPPANDLPFVCSSDLSQIVNSLEGLYVLSSGPNPPPSSTIEEKVHPAPGVQQILLEALNAANIQGVKGGYGYSNDPLDTITVSVGFRPRDKIGILPLGLYERMRREGKSLNDISDDDF